MEVNDETSNRLAISTVVASALLATACSLLVPNPDDYSYRSDGSVMDAGPRDAAVDSGLDASMDAGLDIDAGPCGTCPADRPQCRDDGMCVQCLAPEECDDFQHCTTDRCTLEGLCSSSEGILCVPEIAPGFAVTCARLAGTAYCWGSSSVDGNPATMNPSDTTSPTAVPGLTNVTSISTRFEHVCAVHGSGEVSCWGRNSDGQLGPNATANPELAPVRVPGLGTAVQVAAGELHTCARIDDGSVWCWGRNSANKLGDPSAMESAMPLRVPGIVDAVELVVGARHGCVRTSAGSVRCWGIGSSGVLGDGVDRMGGVPDPVDVSGLTDAVRLSAGSFHTCALRSDRTVVCWGEGATGALGDGGGAAANSPTRVLTPDGSRPLSDVTSIGAGATHTCASIASGEVYCWGVGTAGQTGQPGLGVSMLPELVPGISDAIAVFGGFTASFAATGSGLALLAWGANASGQLGTGTTGGATPMPQVVDPLML